MARPVLVCQYRLTRMGLRLRVRESEWMQGVAAAASERPGLIPVVKGNGYGFGRRTLMPIAAGLAEQIAVGTVYEAADAPADRLPLVLTPHLSILPADLPDRAVLTVGHIAHVDALARQGRRGAVAVKLQSSMRRYGASPAELPALLAAVGAAGCTVSMFSIHLPLDGDDSARIGEIERWLPHLPADLPVAVSHLGPDAHGALVGGHPDRTFRIRVGTALWHRDKSQFDLTADVLDVHRVAGGDVAGYRAVTAPSDGSIAVVAAGSAHGVRAHDDGRSPFHFRHRRLTLLEPPHMHTSLVFVADGEPVPVIGDRVDVQRPLITTTIDELEWLRD